jgi:hypothetical protein
MKYRLLPAEEWDRLDEVLAPQFIPSPQAATAAVAEDDEGRIQGVLFLQLQLHMEPLLITSSRVSFKRLQETLHAQVAEHRGLCYFAFTDDPKVARMAELCGMEHVPMQVFRKEVV